MKFFKIFNKKFKTDGCTFFPDKLFGVNMGSACKNHDYRRRYKTVSVPKADELFRHELLDLGTKKWLAYLMWAAVVLARPFYESEYKIWIAGYGVIFLLVLLIWG